MASMCERASARDSAYAMALAYAAQLGDARLQTDIRLQQEVAREEQDLDSILYYAKQQTGRYGNLLAAATIVQIYLEPERWQADSVELYLEMLRTHEAPYADYARRILPYYEAAYLSRIGQAEKAAASLSEGYAENTLQVSDKDLRTIDVARYYDLEQERLRLTQQRSRNRWVLLLALSGILLLAAIVVILWLRYQNAEAKRHMEHHIQSETIIRLLRDRMELTRAYRQAELHGHTPRVERWLLDPAEIDPATGGFFSRLKERYPSLTPSDIQFLCFTLVEASDEDLAIILNQQKASIYQRRLRVKGHIGEEITDLRQWLITQLDILI